MEKGIENKVSNTFYTQPKTGGNVAQSTFPQAPQRLLLLRYMILIDEFIQEKKRVWDTSQQAIFTVQAIG